MQLDPMLVLARARAATLPTPAAAYLAVYTASSDVSCVERMAQEAAKVGWTVRLWALDRAHPDLAKWTMGAGPGMPGANINRLAEGLPPDVWIVKSDDDVRMRDGDLVRWLTLAARLQFDITQPGQGPGSHASHGIVRRSRRCIARETTFVELGPLTAFSPRARPRVMPQPEDGFGWGIELEWHDLIREGFHLGIVDATPMWHLRPPGMTYARELEERRQAEMFRARGLNDWGDVQRVLRCIRWT